VVEAWQCLYGLSRWGWRQSQWVARDRAERQQSNGIHVKIVAISLFREARHTTIFWPQSKIIDWAKEL